MFWRLNGTFEDSGIPQWKDKLAGMGADGVSENLGKKAESQRCYDNTPHLVDFHCLPHRLEQALIEVQKSCHQVEVMYDVLQMIWKAPL